MMANQVNLAVIMKTLDILEAAEFLKCERTHTLKLAGSGILPGAKIGKNWVFLEDDLIEYLRMQVRLQQRERSAEAEVQINLDVAVARSKTLAPIRSPLSGRNKPKRLLPNLDLYDSPEPGGQRAAA